MTVLQREQWLDAGGVATLVVVLGWGVATLAAARGGASSTATK